MKNLVIFIMLFLSAVYCRAEVRYDMKTSLALIKGQAPSPVSITVYRTFGEDNSAFMKMDMLIAKSNKVTKLNDKKLIDNLLRILSAKEDRKKSVASKRRRSGVSYHLLIEGQTGKIAYVICDKLTDGAGDVLPFQGAYRPVFYNDRVIKILEGMCERPN